MEFNWRYEIKYILTTDQWLSLQKLIIEHPAGFSPAFPDRIINNIYYDTPDLNMCRDNLSGISERKKIRLRWYGNANQIHKPVLEEKIKNNSLGRKKNVKLSISNYAEINQWIEQEHLYIGTIIPVLKNRYLRSYYLNTEGNFRLTVDRNVSYQRADQLSFPKHSQSIQDNRIILELKFAEKDQKREKEITNFIPFRPSKHSKYVTGVLACYS